MTDMLPTSDRIDVCRMVSTSLTDHGQYMSFFRSRPGVAEILRSSNGRTVLLLEPGFDEQEDWVLASGFTNPTGDPEDGRAYSALLFGKCPADPEQECAPARRLALPESGGYVQRVDICRRVKSHDGTISSIHFSRKSCADYVSFVNRSVLLLGLNFDDGKDWVIAGLSEGFPGCCRDKVGSCLAGLIPRDFESATAALQALKRYQKLCGDSGHPHSVNC